MHDHFLAKTKLSGLPEEDLAALAEHYGSPIEVAARTEIVSPTRSGADVHVLVEGWACKYKLLSDGRRQIVAFKLPGDICDLERLGGPPAGIVLVALSDCRVSTIPVDWLNEARIGRPAIGQMLWSLLMRENAAMTEQIVALGRRTSRQRIAYLLCDILERLQAVGEAADGRFRTPLTQTDMADALGLSTVHVNRTLQGLRENGLLEVRGRSFRIPQPSALKAAASFERQFALSA